MCMCIHPRSSIRKLPVLTSVSDFFMVSGFPDSGFLCSIPFSWRKKNPLLKPFDKKMRTMVFLRI